MRSVYTGGCSEVMILRGYGIWHTNNSSGKPKRKGTNSYPLNPLQQILPS